MDNFLHKLKTKCRKWHLLLGLLGLAWFAALSLSGILLNHPDLLAEYQLSRSLLPGSYEYEKWNRGSFRGMVNQGAGGLIYGEAGVWLWDGTDAAPVSYSKGLPVFAYQRDVRALIRAGGNPGLLLAALRGGFFVKNEAHPEKPWERISLPGETEPFVDVFTSETSVYALTRSNLYAAPLSDPTAFSPATPGRTPDPEEKQSLFRLVFEMHSGETWGFWGRIFVDLLGAASIFLCFTGGWFWYRKKQKTLAQGSGGKAARKGLGLHIKWGTYLAVPLAFVALTGFFQRPPFLIAIAQAGYPAWLYPAPSHENPWHDKLRKGLYDPELKTIVLSTSDGVFELPEADLKSGALPRKLSRTPPISVMGATVFRKDSLRGERPVYRVGSMSGLFTWDRTTGKVTDVFTGKTPGDRAGMPVGNQSVVGFARASGGWLWADYGKGLSDLQSDRHGPKMPAELADGGRISLWHALFELHNGRMFDFLLGWFSWIVVPLGGLAFLAVVLTGLARALVKK